MTATEAAPLSAADVRGLYRSLSSWTGDRAERLDQVRHDQRLRRMADDQQRLRQDMQSRVRDARQYRPAHANPRVEELLERDADVEAELHEAELSLDALNQAIDEVRARIHAERQADLVADQVRRLATIDQRLEKRQAHALTALNQTDTKVRALRAQSEQTQRETALLAGLHGQLARDRHASWAAIGDVLCRALGVVEGRAQSRAALQAAQAEMQRDFEQFERRWLVLCDVLASDRMQQQMFARYADFYAGKVEGQIAVDARPRNLVEQLGAVDVGRRPLLKGEQAMRRKISRARWTRSALLAGIRTTQARLDDRRQILERMCGALHDLTLDQIADRFQIADDRNYANFETVLDLRQYVGELADERPPAAPAPIADAERRPRPAPRRLPDAIAQVEDVIADLARSAAAQAQQCQALRAPVQAVLDQLDPRHRALHRAADFLDLFRMLEQHVLDLLDRAFNVNAEEPAPVDPDAVADAALGQYAERVRIEPPTTGGSGPDQSDDDGDWGMATAAAPHPIRDLRSAPPIYRRGRSLRPSMAV